jgi:hypothetical protein
MTLKEKLLDPMKNILFHSGEFWFNEKGFPEKPSLGDLPYHNKADAFKKANAEYKHALQLALSDSVKFSDGELINHIYYRNLKEGQTFFVEGVEVKIHCDEYHQHTKASCKVAVLSNSPVKSETPNESAKESEDEIEECNAFTDFGDVPQRDEGYYWVKLKTKKKGRQFEVARWNGERWMRTFTRYSTASVDDKELEEIGERLQPKAEPTVEGEKPRMDNGWIKSEDLLPEDNVAVLVFIPQEDDHITAGMWDVSNKWVLLDDYRVPDCQITYWRPMVDLPEDKSFVPSHDSEKDDSTTETIRKLQNRIATLEARDYLWSQGENPSIIAKDGVHFVHDLIVKHLKERKKPEQQYCDMCDGVGWYEGGKTLQTTCEQCNGTGFMPLPSPPNQGHT